MAAANIGNLGPSPVFDNLGASLNYYALPGFAKWSLMLLMLAGRIEIVALVSLILPAYWRKNK
jgi:trk system potassium uptake protein TrkH